MKKQKFLFMAIAMVALLFASCTDPEEPDAPTPTPTPTNNSFPNSMPACAPFVDQIIDGGFENQWFNQTTSFDTYLEYRSTVFTSLNSLHAMLDVPAMQLTQSPITTYCDSVTPHTGRFALKLVTGELRDASHGRLLIPGATAPLDTTYVYQFLTPDEFPDGINVKRPYTARPTVFKGYYRYTPVAGDSASMIVRLYDGDQIIGEGVQMVYNDVNAWTGFDAHINYTSSATPTHISIILSSSAGYNFADLTNCQGQVGSTLWIDDLEFEF